MKSKKRANYHGLPCIECKKPVDHYWYSHRKCRACNSEMVKRKYNPKLNRQQIARRKYGVDLNKLLHNFPTCGICNVPLEFNKFAKGFAIDHDHSSKRVRGLLCNACNRGIGLLNDSPERLAKAIEWIKTALVPSEYLIPVSTESK